MMVEKCDGCEQEDIEFVIINGQMKDKLCEDCASESVFGLINSNKNINFEVKTIDGLKEIICK